MSSCFPRICGLLVCCVLSPAVASQDFKPAPSAKPDAATLKNIADKTAELGKAIEALRKQGMRDPFLADVEVYHRGAVWIVEQDEFFQKESAAWTLETLERGLERARRLAKGDYPWLFHTGKSVVRAYRSRIDGSVQPYAITFPASYFKFTNRKWRLDVVLHGRDKNLNEVKFLHQHNGDKPAAADLYYVRLDIFGRGNNAYRWAGETDVLEAVQNFLAVESVLERDRLIDRDRVVLRGFSMGGAGTWHLGLHMPDRWCVLGPGAGFTTTRGYLKNLPTNLPDYQEKCLHIYDAVDYAENAFNVPIVAYSGAKDPQMQAAVNIENALKKAGMSMTHLVAPDLEHKFPPEWQKKAELEYGKHVAKRRDPDAPRVRFVTWTLRYPACHWVEILGLGRHYDKAVVDAERTEHGYVMKTANVRALRLTVAGEPSVTIKIDGTDVAARPWPTSSGQFHVVLAQDDGRWTSVMPQRFFTQRSRTLQKIAGLQGPIDDAFTDSFVCVRGSGKAWHEATSRYADETLRRFQAEWAKYFRGQLPVKSDVEISNEDIANKNLILFGDPQSNSLIAQAVSGLPVTWTKDVIRLGGQKFAARDHMPVLIYPSPFNAGRYVVLNSGHTFGGADFQGTNALLYPRLGDYAVLRLGNGAAQSAVATAGLFDESWRLAPDWMQDERMLYGDLSNAFCVTPPVRLSITRWEITCPLILPSFLSPVRARGCCLRPRASPRKCCRSAASRPCSTSSRSWRNPASSGSCSSPDRENRRSRTTSISTPS